MSFELKDRVHKVFEGTVKQNDAALSREQVQAIMTICADIDFAKAVMSELDYWLGTRGQK